MKLRDFIVLLGMAALVSFAAIAQKGPKSGEELKGAYGYDKFDKPETCRQCHTGNGNGLLAEITVLPKGPDGKWYVSALYNDMASDYEQDGVNVMDYQTATAAVHYLFARNVRASAEYTYIIRGLSRGDDCRDRSKYSIGVVAAF